MGFDQHLCSDGDLSRHITRLWPGLFWLPRRVLCHVLPMIPNCVIPRASGRCSLLYVMALVVNEIHHMNMTKSVLFLAYASCVLTRVVFFHSTFEFDAYAFCASLCSSRNCPRPRHSVLSANICAFPYLAFPLWTLNWKTSCIMRKNVGNLYFGVCALRLLQQCKHGCVICGFTLLDSFQSIVCVPRASLEIFWPCKVYAENNFVTCCELYRKSTFRLRTRTFWPYVQRRCVLFSIQHSLTAHRNVTD